MVMTTLRIAGSLVMVLTTAGCFDAHSVDPGPLVIDDFEDGDTRPADPQFDTWGCGSFNPPTTENCTCGVVPNPEHPNSLYAMQLTATIQDPSDGRTNNGGAGVVSAAAPPRDFTAFDKLILSAKLESGNRPLPTDARFYVELHCTRARTMDGATPGNLLVIQPVDYETGWKDFSLEMTRFGLPSWDSRAVEGGKEACLRQIDRISFTVNAQLPDGQSGQFILSIDDIALQ